MEELGLPGDRNMNELIEKEPTWTWLALFGSMRKRD